jgi:predicted phosphohydrolase
VTQEKSQLITTLDQWKQSQLGDQSRLTDLEGENKILSRELERVRRDLADNMAREPVLQEQVEIFPASLDQYPVVKSPFLFL